MKTWQILLAIVAVILVVRYFLLQSRSKRAHELVEAGALLLDVRTKDEFSAGHLPNAKNIPVQELEQRMGELGNNQERPVVVYCRSGMRSARAASMLERAGFREVVDLGPMSAW